MSELFIEIQREVDGPELPSDADFERWVALALEGQRDEAEVCIRLVDPAESPRRNSTYRGKDKPTNVLSFPFEAPPGVPTEILGDLAICAEVVATEATEQKKPLHNHWAHMVIHGILHLIGFDHINEADAEQMESLEIQLLEKLNIPDPYFEGE